LFVKEEPRIQLVQKEAEETDHAYYGNEASYLTVKSNLGRKGAR
jgi:hypothetical protein